MEVVGKGGKKMASEYYTVGGPEEIPDMLESIKKILEEQGETQGKLKEGYKLVSEPHEPPVNFSMEITAKLIEQSKNTLARIIEVFEREFEGLTIELKHEDENGVSTILYWTSWRAPWEPASPSPSHGNVRRYEIIVEGEETKIGKETLLFRSINKFLGPIDK